MTDDHSLTITHRYNDPGRLAMASRVGQSALGLERMGLYWLLPDATAAVCSCGEQSPWLPDWSDARWWAREHRTSLGLDWQQSLPTTEIAGPEPA